MNLRIGGLQGEFRDLDIKYLNQKISKCQSQISGSFRRISQPCKRTAKFCSMKDTILQPKADLAALRNWPSAWSDRLPMAVTPSFQLWIMHHLKRWIANFPSFKMKYSMHKLSSKKCSKSGWQWLSSKILHGRFLFASPPCISDLLMAKDFKALVLHVSKLSIAFPWIPKNSPQSWIALVIKLLTKNTKTYTKWLEMIAKVLNMLIGLTGDKYCLKVFKRVNYKLSNNTFWVVINDGHDRFFSSMHDQSWL